MRKTGNYKRLGSIDYFIPEPLPPKDPDLVITPEMLTLFGEAMQALGNLNGMVEKLPDSDRFIRAYVAKEALLSSAIEGIHTTLLEFFTQSLLESRPDKATQLVINYTQALKKACLLIQKDNLPISSRVILAIHKVLMELAENADPGHYRKQAVRVGNLVPPPADQVHECMTALEHYINESEGLPPLIKAGLVHLQFETLHPFIDGNGRLGRLLIVLMLIDNDILQLPILYPSYYFKKNHLEYYQRLDAVRARGDFEGWITFYLRIMRDSALDAYRRVQDIEALWHLLTKRMGDRATDLRLKALSVIFQSPIINIGELELRLGVSYNTAYKIINDFVEFGFLVQETAKKRNKLFKFQQYLDILNQDY